MPFARRPALPRIPPPSRLSRALNHDDLDQDLYSFHNPDPRLSRVATGCALGVMSLGLAVMAGWMLGIEPLKHVLPQLASMKFNTALGFLLAGAALHVRGTPALRLGLAGAVGLLGALTVVEYLAGSDFGIDQLVIRDAEVVAGQSPGRMSPVTAVCFLLSGAAFGLLGRRATERWAEPLAISVGTVGFIALLGYMVEAQNLYTVPGFASVALHTAAGFAALAAGVLCAVPGGTVGLLLRSRGTGRSLWLGFGALTALLIVLGVVSASGLRSIGADVDAQADVARPRAAAAQEMEANALDFGLEMRTFLVGDAAARARAETSAEDVARYLAQYEQLAENPRHRELAARFTTLWRAFHTQGEVLMAAGREDRVALAHIVTLRLALKKFLDDEMQPEAVASYNASRAATAGTIQGTERLTLLLLVGGVVLALVTSGGVIRAVVSGELTLRQGEERFRLLVEQIPDGIFVADRAGRYTDVNPAGAAMLGYTREEMLCLGMLDVITPGELSQLAANLPNDNDGAITRVEYRFRRKDRSEFHGEVVGRQTPGGGYVGILRDMTERKRAEDVVRLNAALFATIIEQAPGGVYVMDAQLRVREVNTEALPVFATVQPVIGRELGEVLETLWGPELGRECTAIFRRTLETGERYISPRFDHLRHDLGLEQAYEWETQRITLPDGQHGVVCYFKDVTERERAAAALLLSEERLRLAQDAARIGSFDWNIRTNVNVWTPELEAIYGLPPGGFARTQTGWESLIHPADRAEAVRVVERAIATGEPVEGEWRTVWPDESVHWLLGRFQVFTDAAGEPLRMTGVNLDITERKQAEEQLRLLNRDLEQRVAERVKDLATKARLLVERNAEIELARVTLEDKAAELALASRYKSEFLANMSHELRTPLNSILIFSQQLAENTADNLTEKQVEFSRHINSSGSDLLHLINDILDLSKIESGTVTAEINEIPFFGLRDAIDSNFQHVAEAKHLPLHLHFADDLPRAMDSDPKRLQRILNNLVSNAVKFTAQGQVEVRVRFATQGWSPEHPVLGKATQVISFAVEDTGIGIAPEQQQLIFEAFRQADAGTSRKYGGTGLGLAISRELAALLGGEITLASVHGQGSTFTLFLPLHYSGPDAVRPAPATVPFAARETPLKLNGTPHPHAPDQFLRGRTVLVVDDDARNVFGLTSRLENEAMNVMSATNGRDAIDRIQETPDLSIVLMDVMMPDMDGYETMREIRRVAELRTLPILALTARAMNGDREKCLAAGASDYIAKPVNADQLLSLMRAWLS